MICLCGSSPLSRLEKECVTGRIKMMAGTERLAEISCVPDFMKEKEQTLKLLILLSLLLVAGFSATSWISYRVSRQALRNQIINDELPLTSDNVYSEIQRDLLPPVFIASLMANDSFLRNWVLSGEKEPERLTQFLFETQRKYNTFTSFFVSEKTRHYYQSKGILKTVREGDPQDNWYFRVRQMKPEHEINVDPDQANQYAMTIFVNHKVFDFNGRYIGATGVGLQVRDVKQIIESYHKKFNRIIYFISPQGKIILSTDGSDGKNVRDLPGVSAIASRIVHTGAANLEYTSDGKTYFVNTRYIPELDWILLVSKSDEHALRDIFRSLLLNLALCGLVTVVVICLIYVIINSYRKKLRDMFLVEVALTDRNNEQKNEIEKQHRQLVEQNAKLVQLNASKDKLFSIIAHDLRTPIGNMNQLAALCEDSLASGNMDEVKEYLADQRELSISALQLLDHLFDWARSQKSEMSSTAANFSLPDCLKESLSALEIPAGKKKIELSLQCPPDIAVSANRNMLMTIVRNLASNAVKFTPSGGRIEISASAGEEKVTVSVKDSGIGIAPERLKAIFELSNNKSTLGTGGERGTGIGLSLCRELVRKNGGEIEVESTPGAGSTFRFTLRKAR